ncbi:MAG TPA: PQQ-binding-like beta-propeller repeat protein, partial [Terriglobales bacterium]
MQNSIHIAVCAAILLVCLTGAAEPADQPTQVSAAVDVLPADLTARQLGANWVSYNGDYSGKRFSSLSQISTSNVNQLQAQWVFHTNNSDRMEVTPVVVNGVMFVTAGNETYSLDATTGREIWRNVRAHSEGLIDDASRHISRGVALWHSKVFRLTDNAHLLCLDARSGNLLWDVAYADWNKNYGATGAPLVVNDKVIVGTSGGDDGVRGFVAAYDANSGKMLWRFWTIPGPGEFGSSSWPGDLYLHGGATTWMPGTYDAETNTLFWTTSNASPDFDGEVRPGDDLYTACVLALDPDTGKLKWYFQFTPHDLYDFDATETPMLIDTVYAGEPRKLLVQANRNGFVYVLDRINGKFLNATRFANKLTWAKGIDAQGRPILTDLKPSPEGTEICPGFAGATNWHSPSYNESTHFVYFLALEE